MAPATSRRSTRRAAAGNAGLVAGAPLRRLRRLGRARPASGCSRRAAAMRRCGCASACGVHGHDHAAAWSGTAAGLATSRASGARSVAPASRSDVWAISGAPVLVALIAANRRVPVRARFVPSLEITSLGACKMRVINALALATLLLATAGGTSMAQDKSADATPSVAVGRAVRHRPCLCRARGLGPLQR